MRLYVGDPSISFDSDINFSCGTDQWYHVAVTFDDATDTVQLYVNGSLEDTRTYTNTMTINEHPVGIGRDGMGGDDFTGSIDNVRIYDRALSSSEVEALFDFVEPYEPSADPDTSGGISDDSSGGGGSSGCFISVAFTK
jgi:hypothetical protein